MAIKNMELQLIALIHGTIHELSEIIASISEASSPLRLTVDAARFAGYFAVFATFDGLVRVGAGRDRVCSLDLERATATTGLAEFLCRS